MSKKPDMFAENKSVMPYGDNVGAPAIRPDDVDTWRRAGDGFLFARHGRFLLSRLIARLLLLDERGGRLLLLLLLLLFRFELRLDTTGTLKFRLHRSRVSNWCKM